MMIHNDNFYYIIYSTIPYMGGGHAVFNQAHETGTCSVAQVIIATL